MRTAHTLDSRGLFWVLVCFALAAAPLLFMGYGSDNDIYDELGAASSTWTGQGMVTSRPPGFWLHEAIVFALALAGEFVPVNLATLLVSCLVLWRTRGLLRELRVEPQGVFLACVAFNPWFLIAASSALDYQWALLFVIWSIQCRLKGSILTAGLLGGVAIAFRLGSAMPLFGAYAGIAAVEAFRGIRIGQAASLPGPVATTMANDSGLFAAMKRLLGVAAVATILGAIAYYPSWLVWGRTLSFLTVSYGPDAMWTFKMHVGRILYKPLLLFGPLATLVMALLVARAVRVSGIRRVVNALGQPDATVAALAGACVGTALLYAKYPLDIGYMLPIVPFGTALVGPLTSGPTRRRWSAVLLAATISYSVVSVEFARPNVPRQATDASLTLRLSRGPLLEDVRQRMLVYHCRDLDCWWRVNGL